MQKITVTSGACARFSYRSPKKTKMSIGVIEAAKINSVTRKTNTPTSGESALPGIHKGSLCYS